MTGQHHRLSTSIGKYAPSNSIWLSERALKRCEVPHSLIHITPLGIFLLLAAGSLVCAASLFVHLLLRL